MTIEDQLTKFRESWPGTSVTVYNDWLHYSVTFGYGGRAVKRANKLIEFLGLDLLIAESATEQSGFFTIKQKQ
jgi:hypothetical protein